MNSESKLPMKLSQNILGAKSSRAPKLNNKQRQYLTDYMTSHDQLATRGKLGIHGNNKYKSMWMSLTTALNNIGPSRTWQQWVTTWQQIVRKARDVNGAAKLAMRSTGNPDAPEELTAEHEKILSTLGKEASSGMEETIPSLGFIPNESENDYIEKAITSQSLSGSSVISCSKITNFKNSIINQRRNSPEYIKSTAMKRRRDIDNLNETSKANLQEMKRMNANFELWAPRLVNTFEKMLDFMKQNSTEGQSKCTCTESSAEKS